MVEVAALVVGAGAVVVGFAAGFVKLDDWLHRDRDR